MEETQFVARLSQLRAQKGVSARDMSLSIGQNPSYINCIENGKMLPSLTGFFYICEYLNISPMEFFDESVENPAELKEIIANLKLLNASQRQTISDVIQEFLRK